VRLNRLLLLGFVILSCMLIVLIWTINMTQQGAEAARPVLVTAGQIDESIGVTPSPFRSPTFEPHIQPGSIPTLSNILEDQ